MFRPPGRPTFVNSDKSRQKHRKEPPVPSLPGALCRMRNCDTLPHVCVRFSFLFCYRIVSAPAPLPLIPITNNDFGSTVASHERQRRKKKIDSSFAAITNIYRERAVNGRIFITSDSAGGFLNRRFKLSFWSLLGQRPKVTRARRHGMSPRAGARNSPLHKGALKNHHKETL